MKDEKKIRIDLLLSRFYPALSRSRLQAEIMAGRVYADGHRVDKPGTLVKAGIKAEIKEAENPYVSRGGLKLKGALADCNLNVKNKIVLDVGASTGGFTDCLLKHGASHVIALDVGYGQLAAPLRTDKRVTVLERFNVRHLKESDLTLKPDLAVVDVSFISLTKVLPVLAALKIKELLVLVKPQFETEKRYADRGKGVIGDACLHKKALEKVILAALELGYGPSCVTFSEKPGPKGNIEYFVHLLEKSSAGEICLNDYAQNIESAVKEAHLKLKQRF